MSHKQRMRASLQSLVDGELPDARRAALSKHLDECAECAAVLCRLQESDRLLSAARPEPAALSPAASRALLERALAQAAVSRRAAWMAPVCSWQFAAALVLAAAAAGWWVYATPLTPGTPHAGGDMVQHPSDDARAGTVWDAVGPLAPVPATAGASAKKGAPVTKHTPRSDKQTPTAKKKSPAVVPPSETRPRPEQPPRRIAPPRYRLALSEYEAPAERAWACAAPVEASPALQPGAQLVSDPATEPAPELPAAAPGAPEVVEPAPETAAPGQLLVIVTDGRAPAPVQVTQAPEAAPGYAQASTFCADLDGRWTWTQATVARECSGHEQSLVMLGGDIRQWGEEDDHDAMGSEGDQYGNSEDGAARGAVEPVDDRAGSGPARPQ